MNAIERQVIEAEEELLSALRGGELMRGVAMHQNSPDYRNIWNGEMKTYDELSARIGLAMERGLTSIDYQVADRRLFILDEANVLATLIATETTRIRTGEAHTSGKTVISILWRKVGEKWALGYLHASEEPKFA